jgi:hypothetical protein
MNACFPLHQILKMISLDKSKHNKKMPQTNKISGKFKEQKILFIYILFFFPNILFLSAKRKAKVFFVFICVVKKEATISIVLLSFSLFENLIIFKTLN